ncbi:MAG: 4-(cytidine 5'-diphospho)-2-C-methyl-D-erythritol kinase [Blastocatellia bacterium]|nr:4-(cytidine 5'-diphospho)-2-C-methyl-D-erythritol kinase [Blastocatellia bacterium]MCX7751540.1 4-(cytidine 5'-diphospho)-2-C-methyl-D-erythritol kinase [Blastocatellia bacterium]MDW8168640.1 4-(cytidine 5'-diphospho)-2-C-methyl-D-erythritol kinase [Acidobacteriota bacterium]
MRLSVPAFAKINWMLEVLDLRPDGYHEIRTVLQTIALADVLHFEWMEDGIEVACTHPQVPKGPENLVFRAAERLRSAKGVKVGARIRIEKRIPVAAGLGGGSSNAAVALLALARLWEIPLGPEELLGLGRELGADVPFFFIGGTALGIGRGDEVYPLPDVRAEVLVLANPGFALSTSWAYGQLTKRAAPGNISVCSRAWHRAVRAWPAIGRGEGGEATRPLTAIVAGNDFEAVVRERYPELTRGLERLRECGALAVGLSGSGPTIFGVFESEREAEQAEAAFATLGWWRARTRTVDRSEYWARLTAGLSGEANGP